MPVVCLAGQDVASQFKDLRRAFTEKGWEVISYVRQRQSSPIIEEDAYDFVGNAKLPKFLSRPIKRRSFSARAVNYIGHRLSDYYSTSIVKELAQKCDLFIFIWSSFKADYQDLEYIKSQGKKIVFIFCGDDARWYYGMKQEFEQVGLPPVDYGTDYDYGVKGLRLRLQRIRTAEKYADFIFSKREQAQLQIRPFYHFPMCVYPQDYEVNLHQRETNPVVVHAPSHTSVKGTKYILSAFENLKQKGVHFTPVLLQNKNHKEAKELYTNADVVIDQLVIPGGGKLSTEALACGKVVMGKMAYGIYEQGYPIDECPIIDVGIADIEAKLLATITQVEQRKQRATKAREYVLKFLTVQGLVNKIIRLYNGENISYDYVPEFFQNKYIPESIAAREEINKWNRYVSSCVWYKDIIHVKQRDGIGFYT